ncbi:N-methyl-L-tryptophan oxidase [Actinacidiphila glaucinigra]|uniref:Sarcosine oxidase n=1 Tax=Actinacidiphila glaucinigra TaxID=235986 RepID=A0A239NMN6_9ACTN|nr:N-methyl-L-tryptophan oxidase [Actinacidiphila glaucinigra]SNT56161.1 sarcosine oxidase [Actinacidiphila glaucinigra]
MSQFHAGESSTTRRYDLAVVGLGVMGAMVAWRAAAMGADVIALDPYVPGHRRGASHGGSRIFRTLCHEGVDYGVFARASLQIYRELEAATRTELLLQCGGLTIGPPGHPLVSAAAVTAETVGVAYERLDSAELRARYPQHAPMGKDIGLFEPTAGVLRPEAAVRAAVQASRAAGASVLSGVRCLKLRHEADGPTLFTNAGVIRARKTVLAIGGWTNDLVPDLELPLQVRRSVLCWFRDDTECHGTQNFPVFIRVGSGLDGWGIPDVDGRGVKVGLGGPHPSKRLLSHPDDNWGMHPVSVETAPVSAYVTKALPGLQPITASAEACMDVRTPDGHFVLGSHPRLADVVLCTGFSGHGFKHAPAVGTAVAQYALHGRTDFPIDAFAPDRFDRST